MSNIMNRATPEVSDALVAETVSGKPTGPRFRLSRRLQEGVRNGSSIPLEERSTPMKHILMRLALVVLGLVLIGHALIHLGIIPGGIQGPDGRTGWSGHSGLLDQFLGAPVVWVIAMALLAGTILFFVAGGLGLFGVPLLKERWKAASIVASILSLLLFAVSWTGILPHPSAAVFGPVISGVVLIGLLVGLLLERTVLQPKARHARDRL